MSRTIESRIEVLARRDRLLAATCTAAMWCVLVFVFVTASAVAPTTGVSIVLGVSCLMLGLFNTASIVAMLRVHSANRDLVYRQDIVNLDLNRRQRARKGW